MKDNECNERMIRQYFSRVVTKSDNFVKLVSSNVALHYRYVLAQLNLWL